MFKCDKCKEKDAFITFLKEQNKDLHDRLMAFNKEAFSYYKAENGNNRETLYPRGVDEKGEIVDYSKFDIEQMRVETLRAWEENPRIVEDKHGT